MCAFAIIFFGGLISVADATTADVQRILQNAYGDKRASSSATGSWEEPSSLAALWQAMRSRWQEEGERLAALGKAGGKEQARDMYGIGHGVNAYDAAKEGRYPAALGNAAMSVLDLTAPVSSPAVATADMALKAWSAAHAARPAQVAEELARLTTKRMKPTGAAADRRAAAAERAVPWPEVPEAAHGSPQAAQAMLDLANRTWPGNVGAGAIAAGGASGIPGIALDSARDVLSGPVGAYDQEVRDYRQPEKSYRLDDPHIKKIYEDMARTNNVLARHLGAGAGLSAATPALAKLGWRGVQGWAVPAALELGMVHPVLGLAAAGLAGATMIPAMATGAGAAKVAMDTGPLRDRALMLKEILDGYGRKGRDRIGPTAQASYPREGE